MPGFFLASNIVTTYYEMELSNGMDDFFVPVLLECVTADDKCLWPGHDVSSSFFWQIYLTNLWVKVMTSLLDLKTWTMLA